MYRRSYVIIIFNEVYGYILDKLSLIMLFITDLILLIIILIIIILSPTAPVIISQIQMYT